MQAMSALDPGVRFEAAPSHGFRCLLDVQPDTWVPRELRTAPADPPGDCCVNPDLRYTPGGFPGDAVPHADAVSTAEPTAWVGDPVSGVLTPYALGPELAASIAALEPGSPLARSLPADTVSLLRSAGILLERDSLPQQRGEWQARVAHAAREFRDGYASLGSLLHPFALGAARVYFRRLIRQRRASFGDGQSAWRWFVHNEPVARFFHHQLTPIVAAVAGVALKPSYVYFCCYESGANLKWHTDREQCEISLSMLLDYSPQPASAAPWPLVLQTRRGRVAIHQRLGETLAYRGGEIPHARDRLPAGHVSMHLFFHYVALPFSGVLD